MIKDTISTWPLYTAILFILCSSLSCKRPSIDDFDPDVKRYGEKHRPQFHFSPPEKWMNDPNGLVYFDDEYHLFYQFYPDSNVWGPMHWGHAVSRDLVHWENLPIALYPDSLGYIFSGSAVVDWKNTSGFGQDSIPLLLAIFTYHDPLGEKANRTDYQSQGIAYSIDKGRTWTKYALNPVLPNDGTHKDFRDPKVFWHSASGQWIMVLAVLDHIELWSSPDLKSWKHLSDWGQGFGAHTGVWECPDLFPLNVDESNEIKWVLLQSLNPGAPNGGSGTQYFVGDFDGVHFVLDSSMIPFVDDGKALWLDQGRDNYAGVTWSDVNEESGRRLWIGWMSNWEYAQKVPTTVWRSAMTLPREIRLKNTSGGYRLFTKPGEEVKTIRSDSLNIGSELITDEEALLLNSHSSSQSELILEFEFEENTRDFGISLSNAEGEEYRLGYDARKQQFYSDRSKAGDYSFSDTFGKLIYSPNTYRPEKTSTWHVFIDVSSIEIFVDDGAISMTEIFFPSERFDTIQIFSADGDVKLVNGRVYSLSSIWNR